MTHAAPLLDEPGMLRHLGPGEGPYPGRLYAGDPPTVRVPAELIPAEAWANTGRGHLLAPRDLARTARAGSGAGHTAVVTHCPHRLAAWLGEDATAGELVTVTVSVLRAAQEARRAGIAAGTWWIDATGRPVLAPVLSPAAAPGASDVPDWSRTGADLLGRIVEIAPPAWRAEIDAAAALVRAQRGDDDAVAACEDRIFALAAPAPLRMPGAEVLPHSDRARGARGQAPPEGPRSQTVGESWLGRFTDAEWARRVEDAIEGAHAALRGLVARAPDPRRAHRARARVAGDPSAEVALRETRRRGRAPWIVAAVVGAAVVAGGLMWPDGADREGSASVREADDDVSVNGGPAATDAGSVVPDAGTEPVVDRTAAPSDLEDTARDLLRDLATCGESAACDRLLESPAAGDGAKALAAELGRGTPEGAWTEELVVSLVDEYGGAAVLRVGMPDQTARMLVLVLVDAKWLVRDAYDVADQP